MIDEPVVTPRRRLVTALAQARRSRMRLRLSRRRYRVMAADALPRRIVKTAVDMARRTGDA